MKTIKMGAFLFSLIIVCAAFLYEAPPVQGSPCGCGVPKCMASTCIVGGKSCICCLQSPNDIACSSCGAVDCTPSSGGGGQQQ
jgi:hypothetical protein